MQCVKEGRIQPAVYCATRDRRTRQRVDTRACMPEDTRMSTTAGTQTPGEFGGVIGRYYWESTPWWPEPQRARAGAPNVLLVVLDDVGFAQIGCFGSDIDTPAIDRLAASGLRYSNFHTTALCSPTRACLLTGRNHHSNGMGRIIELATGFPGY